MNKLIGKVPPQRPRLLDLFCCAGGCSVGYHRAGFDVVGVDIKHQKNYPFEFVQGDALDYLAAHGHEFDVIHASPPCQAYSVTQHIYSVDASKYPMLIDVVRAMLIESGKLYVIENVPGAPLDNPLILNGHHFGLKVIRNRWFETNPWMMSPGYVEPKKVFTHSGHGQFSSFANGATHISVAGHDFKVADARVAMDIDWMTQHELAQAIPPAYTEWIGKQLMEII